VYKLVVHHGRLLRRHIWADPALREAELAVTKASIEFFGRKTWPFSDDDRA
jgi:hypothetical protein